MIQGDGGIEDADGGSATSAPRAARRLRRDSTGGVSDPIGPLTVVASFEAGTDGEDYVEGGGGNDVIMGGLGQDDLVGGSSAHFNLVTPNHRPDGDDYLFGGAGVQIDRNDEDLPGDGTVATKRHARDADTMAGDNADIIRIVGVNGVDVNPTSIRPARCTSRSTTTITTRT